MVVINKASFRLKVTFNLHKRVPKDIIKRFAPLDVQEKVKAKTIFDVFKERYRDLYVK